MREVWKDIEEFKGVYQVSNYGQVRSKKRYINTRTYPSVIMSQYIGNNDCLMVRLRNGKSQVRRSVAKLVLLTFEGDPTGNSRQVKHLDGNPNNNRIDNLEWDTNTAYGLPENHKARELFKENAEKNIDIFIYRNMYHNVSFGEADIDDFKQECLIAIWAIIDMVENATPENFYGFCQKKCRWVFDRFYKKYTNRHRYIYFSEITNKNSDDCFADNLKELSITDTDDYKKTRKVDK